MGRQTEVLRACGDCLRDSWLLTRLSGHLDRLRGGAVGLLGSSPPELIAAVSGRDRDAVAADLEQFEAEQALRQLRRARLDAICRCDAGYPARVRELPAAPAVLHVAGGLQRFLALTAGPAAAIVGSRRPSPYGVEVAEGLSSALSGAGGTVVSGMASGIDAAAHRGALADGARTIAVLPGGADRPYPAGARPLYRRILASGAVVVSELPPGTAVRRWTLLARNRIVAALAETTVVVEATAASGSLVTARRARQLGRPVAAVPGRISSPLAAGPHALIADGATLIGSPADLLALVSLVPPARGALVGRTRGAPAEPGWREILRAVEAGHDSAAALEGLGLGAPAVLAGLAALELSGHLRRVAGGRFAVVVG